jgi:hypothetical protein
MKTRLVGLLIDQLLLPILLPSDLRAAPCDDAGFIARAKAVKTWDDFHRFVKRFRSCPDDGLFAEGYSDIAAHILATKWNTLRELQVLTKTDTSFRRFVIEHIDATADRTELKTVRQNATQRCPSDASSLCREIAGAAAKAMAQQNAPR